MKNNSLRKLVISAMFAALACVATLVIHVPIPATNGYINLGDCMVLLSGYILGPTYGVIAAAIGSALSDAILGYFIYVPATFVIKGLVALVAALLGNFGKSGFLRLTLAGILSEAIMVAGYYLYESVLYGFVGALGGVAGNLIQATGGIIVSLILVLALGKVNKLKEYSDELHKK